jgi:hypothetical protein
MRLVPVCASKSDKVTSGHQTQPKRQFNIGPGIINELGATTLKHMEKWWYSSVHS